MKLFEENKRPLSLILTQKFGRIFKEEWKLKSIINLFIESTEQIYLPNKLSISPTFYEQLLHQIPYTKKLQSQTVIREKLYLKVDKTD